MRTREKNAEVEEDSGKTVDSDDLRERGKVYLAESGKGKAETEIKTLE